MFFPVTPGNEGKADERGNSAGAQNNHQGRAQHEKGLMKEERQPFSHVNLLVVEAAKCLSDGAHDKHRCLQECGEDEGRASVDGKSITARGIGQHGNQAEENQSFGEEEGCRVACHGGDKEDREDEDRHGRVKHHVALVCCSSWTDVVSKQVKIVSSKVAAEWKSDFESCGVVAPDV
mmetsp:Transcript_10807/g.29871  ORF Transcript_10807/g.29871 Transcript_10807/m.29871 type:complete len:177 (+) Transcript_10807:918-1448(+)